VATVELRLQNAGADAGYLLEALLDACNGARRGGAVFAWANASAVRAFLEDKSFARFVKHGEFDLIIGLDSITDEAALKALTARAAEWPKLSVRAFLHQESALFHPKLAWFESDKMLTLIVGSGNLTMGGLRSNWEAFTVARLTGAEASETVRQLRDWLRTWSNVLVAITDARVIERARQNIGRERSFKRMPKTTFPKESATRQGVEILVAEIPKSDVRWSQANFDRDNYEHFFGARVGTQRRIFLYQVADDGGLGELESRPSVEVKSKNVSIQVLADPRPVAGSMGSTSSSACIVPER
jgi:hypothetical protein